uniref:Putative homing endonuclease n=1 Tax=viral metagenome TaxID=1070528 RepID=A0A6M3IVQ1_9ZZZZ
MNEWWAIIKSYNNYAVSTLGRVRNLKTGRLLKPQDSGKRGGNYLFVNLFKNGKRRNINIHVLVAEAFLGPRPCRMLVHHIDTNRKNPVITNLEYCTVLENNRSHVLKAKEK